MVKTIIFSLFCSLYLPENLIECSYNINDNIVNSTDGVLFRVQTQKYKKLEQKFVQSDQDETQEETPWYFLTPEGLEMSLPQCGQKCLETTDCVGFFIYIGAKENITQTCFMFEDGMVKRSMLKPNHEYNFYEIEVSTLYFYIFCLTQIYFQLRL